MKVFYIHIELFLLAETSIKPFSSTYLGYFRVVKLGFVLQLQMLKCLCIWVGSNETDTVYLNRLDFTDFQFLKYSKVW